MHLFKIHNRNTIFHELCPNTQRHCDFIMWFDETHNKIVILLCHWKDKRNKQRNCNYVVYFIKMHNKILISLGVHFLFLKNKMETWFFCRRMYHEITIFFNTNTKKKNIANKGEGNKRAGRGEGERSLRRGEGEWRVGRGVWVCWRGREREKGQRRSGGEGDGEVEKFEVRDIRVFSH